MPANGTRARTCDGAADDCAILKLNGHRLVAELLQEAHKANHGALSEPPLRQPLSLYSSDQLRSMAPD